jgi:hypothetical protein
MNELICKEPKEPKYTFGEEFVLWAEKYHQIENAYISLKINEIDENCPYSYIRQLFISKINDMLKEKLNLW